MLRLIVFIFTGCVISFSQAATVKLAEDGKALMPIVVARSASEQIRTAAKTLAEQLQRISGGAFGAEEGDGSHGIVLGTAAEFPGLAKDEALTSKAITDRENYVLRSGKDRLLLIGNTSQAVEHAVWDLLYRLGYRQFFPGKTWEVVQHSPSLSVDVDTQE